LCLFWLQRLIAALDCFPPVFPIFAKNKSATSWQCINLQTDVRVKRFADFPAWITEKERFVGEGKRFVNLRQFLHDNCKPVLPDKHVDATNVIYYLVTRNPDYANAKNSQVKKPCLSKTMFL